MVSPSRLKLRPSLIFLALGITAFILPTMIGVAEASWSTEQGGHGPMVLGVSLWLLARGAPGARPLVRPGSAVVTALLLVPLLALFIVARVTSIIEIEAGAMFLSMLVIAYQAVGWRVLLRLWFPILFLAFAFPPPDTLYAMITQPLKIAISQWSVALLYVLGYPVAGSGVLIQIGQYQLLVAAACAGVNSLLSLIALGLLYSYFQHHSNAQKMLLLLAFIVPIAIGVNLVRVLLLMLITYYFGEAAGQGWFHEFAGLFMFVLALLTIYVIDELLTPFARKPASTVKGAA